MRTRTLQLVTLLWVGVSSVGQAIWHRCEREVFTPDAIRHEVLGFLPELGIAALPINQPIPGSVLGGLPGRQDLLRHEQLIGQISFREDARHGFSELAVLDGRDLPFIQVRESHFACPGADAGGPCHLITLSSEREPELAGVPAYAIRADGPLEGARARYFKYGKEIGRYDFTNGVRETLRWLNATLSQTQSVFPMKALVPLDRARWLLASDPYVVGYLSSIRLYPSRGQLVIAGVVPSNFVYGRVIDRVRDAGFRYLRVDLIIDTRTQIPRMPAIFGLAACP